MNTQDFGKFECWHLAKSPRILSPHEIKLSWHGENEGAEVGEGQVEEVDVGGRPHVLVLDDHQAGGQVAQDTQDQEQTARIHFFTQNFCWSLDL